MIHKILSQENPLSLKDEPRGAVPLKAGDAFRGRVIRRGGDGEIVVSFRGSPLAAHTDSSVREGEQYRFLVKSGGERITLGVLEEPKVAVAARNEQGKAAGLSSLLKEISSFEPPRDLRPETRLLLKRLSSWLPGILHTDLKRDPSGWLTRWLSTSGLFWENKVARYLMGGGKGSWKAVLGEDLKGMLLELHRSLGMEGGREEPGMEALSQKVEETVQWIEDQQKANLSLTGEEGGWFVLVPPQPEEGLIQAELLCRGIRGRKEIRFSLFLDFTHLGPLQATASLAGSTLSLVFRAADEERAQLIRENFSSLEASLRAVGLTPGSIQCGVREDPPEEEVVEHPLHVVI